MAPRDLTDYYRTEWEIAGNPADPRHVYPAPSGGRTLDVGCGCGSPPGLLGPDVFGVDVDPDPLRLGRRWGAAHRFAAASAEALPFPARSFDRVLARVSLPYMRLGRSLGEMARVLRPGGELWLALHPPEMAWREFRAARGLRRATRLYVLINGALLHFTGMQMSIGGRSETFQTDRGVARALGRAGFVAPRFDRSRHYVVTAMRR